MKTLKEILENNEPFILSEYYKVQYNAMDHENHKTGKDSTGKKVFTCIYSIYAINLRQDHCFTQSINAWGQYLDEVHKLSELTIYVK